MVHLNISKNRILLLIVFLFTGVLQGNKVPAQSRETLLKAGYIEKFIHFVEWPLQTTQKYQGNKIEIAFFGENPISDALRDIFSKSKLQDKEFTITQINSVDQIKDFMILFISGTEIDNLDKILRYTTGKPILTISDSKNFGERGVIINMFQEGNYIRYEINRSSLKMSGLSINSLLLNYAVIIG
jgi:hypothetical protein